MRKLHGMVGRSGGMFVATLVMAVAMAIGATGVASAAHARHYTSVQGWLNAHGAHVHRSRAGRRVAHTAIVGGNQISIEQAPWQVFVIGLYPVEIEVEPGVREVVLFELLCGGSILDATHVLTAGHCLFNPETDERLEAKDVLVVAGNSNLFIHEAQAQVRLAESLRVHPYYDRSAGAAAADDVAVIALSEGLSLSSAPGSTASSIGLVGAGATPAEGTQLNLTGFGQENPNFEPAGELNSIATTVTYPRRCGGEDDAVFVCTSASGGSACFGDSGSGLTTTGATPALAGVMDIVFGKNKEFCRPASTNGFVNLAAPEIRDFIEGEEAPPKAPRGGEAIEVRGVPKVGYSLSCSPGSWSGDPSIMYVFINSVNGQVLQSGASSTYALTASDVGRTIYCEVQTTNAGGTGVVRTGSLRAIEAAPVEQQPPPSEPPPHEPPPPPVESHSPPPPPPAPGPAPAPGTGTSSGAGTTPPGGTPPTGAGGVEAAKIHNEGLALVGGTLTVQGGLAPVKLDCKEAENCSGTLTLLAKQTIRHKGHKASTHTVKLGVANFSLEAGQSATVKLHLSAAGRALLSAAGGHLAATLTIEESEVHTWTDGVRLVASPVKAKGSHKKKG